MTLNQAKALKPGDMLHHTEHRNADGTPARWKVNGKVKTWKRDTARVQIPVKHGLYDFDYVTERDLDLVTIADLTTRYAIVTTDDGGVYMLDINTSDDAIREHVAKYNTGIGIKSIVREVYPEA